MFFHKKNEILVCLNLLSHFEHFFDSVSTNLRGKHKNHLNISYQWTKYLIIYNPTCIYLYLSINHSI